MQGVKLPPAVFEEHLPKFLGAIWQVPDDHDLEIDFSRSRFYIPVAITSLIARIDYAASNGGKIRLCGLNKCENLRYLQRIDFFNQLKVELDEDFTRYDPQDAFVPVREVLIGGVSIRNDEIATELARCLARGEEEDLFQLA